MFQLSDNGLVIGAKYLESPNYGDRPLDAGVSLLVVHNISLPPGQYGGGHIERLFLNQLDPLADPYFETINHLKVSAHLLIDRQGRVTQFVPLNKRAWHAGTSCFNGEDDCNNYSVGIELEGCDDDPYSDAQYLALAEISCLLISEYSTLNPDRICGHSEIAPGRKTDPGEAFDWDRLRSLIDDV